MVKRCATKLTSAAVALGLAACAVAQEQYAGGWSMKIGAVYRTIDEIEFTEHAVTNPALGASDYMNFVPATAAGGTDDYVYAGDSQSIKVAVPRGPNSASYNIDADKATWRGDDVDSSFLGARLAVEKAFGDLRGVPLRLCIGMTVLGSDQESAHAAAAPGSTAGFDVSHDQYGVSRKKVPGGPPAAPPLDGAEGVGAGTHIMDKPNGSSSTNPHKADQAGLSASSVNLRTSAEIEALVFDIGVAAGIKVLDRLSLEAGAGPTVTLVDFESNYRQEISTAHAGGTNTQRFSDSDQERAVRWGAFLGLGASYMIDERSRLGVQYRYDYVGSDVSTDHAEVDLSGSSVQLLWTRSF